MLNPDAKGNDQSSLCRASHCLGVIPSSVRKAVRKACASGKPHRAATPSSPRAPLPSRLISGALQPNLPRRVKKRLQPMVGLRMARISGVVRSFL